MKINLKSKAYLLSVLLLPLLGNFAHSEDLIAASNRQGQVRDNMSPHQDYYDNFRNRSGWYGDGGQGYVAPYPYYYPYYLPNPNAFPSDRQTQSIYEQNRYPTDAK